MIFQIFCFGANENLSLYEIIVITVKRRGRFGEHAIGSCKVELSNVYARRNRMLSGAPKLSDDMVAPPPTYLTLPDH